MRPRDTFSDTEPAPHRVAFRNSCTVIADQAVPEYRDRSRHYSCTGTVAKRWQAAWDAACIALGGNPDDYKLAGG